MRFQQEYGGALSFSLEIVACQMRLGCFSGLLELLSSRGFYPEICKMTSKVRGVFYALLYKVRFVAMTREIAASLSLNKLQSGRVVKNPLNF